MTLNLQLDAQQLRRQAEAARRLNISVDNLAKAAINDLLAKSETDLECTAAWGLERNAELPKRSA